MAKRAGWSNGAFVALPRPVPAKATCPSLALWRCSHGSHYQHGEQEQASAVLKHDALTTAGTTRCFVACVGTSNLISTKWTVLGIGANFTLYPRCSISGTATEYVRSASCPQQSSARPLCVNYSRFVCDAAGSSCRQGILSSTR